MTSLSEIIERGLAAFRKNAKRGRVLTGPVHDSVMQLEMAGRFRSGNPTHVLTCEDCRHWHDVYAESDKKLAAEVENWKAKHGGHRRRLSSVPIWDRQGGWKHNSDVKQAFGTETAFTVTNLHSLASSATAGWGSAAVDNSSNLYLSALISVHLAAVNTAPGSDKAFYLFGYGSTDGAIWTSTGTSGGTVGSEGTLTFPSISTLPIVMPLVGVVPYPVQNKAIDGGPFEFAAAFRGILPRSWGVAALNFTGMTLAAAGNTVKYHPVYNTVI